MAQDILTVTVSEFRKKVYQITTRNLAILFKGLIEFKWENGKNLPDEQLIDLERKHSVIQAELTRRGEDMKSFDAYYKKLNYKKRLF